MPPGHRLQRVERVETRAAGRVETRKTETEDFGDEDSDDSDDDGAKGGVTHPTRRVERLFLCVSHASRTRRPPQDARKRRRHATESKSLTDQQRVEREFAGAFCRLLSCATHRACGPASFSRCVFNVLYISSRAQFFSLPLRVIPSRAQGESGTVSTQNARASARRSASSTGASHDSRWFFESG